MEMTDVSASLPFSSTTLSRAWTLSTKRHLSERLTILLPGLATAIFSSLFPITATSAMGESERATTLNVKTSPYGAQNHPPGKA